jgi:hypothetical protein
MTIFKLSGLTVAMMLAGACHWAAAAVPFDLNGNGKVDAADVIQAAMNLSYAVRYGPMVLPAGGPSTPWDFNGDAQLSLSDWTTFVAYLQYSAANPSVLFDVDGNGLIDVRDRAAIAQHESTGVGQAAWDLRYDFNGDGKCDAKDWLAFVSYLRKNNPSLLLDFNGDGVVNGLDLDLLARFIDARSYDTQFDLNGDGQLNSADWALAVSIVRQVAPKALYDVDGTSGVGPAVLTSADSQNIARSLNALATGARGSIRYDFNGDGQINGADWGDWVRFAVVSYRKPDLVLDIDANGRVDSQDLMPLQYGYTSVPIQYQFDLNGDGVTNQRDVEVLQARLKYGFTGPLVGDVNRDGCVNSVDLALVQAALGSSRGSRNYDPDLDVDGNGYIDQSDVYLLQGPNYGKCQ